MERVLNQDERIRRAEELYARRKMQNALRKSATVNVEGNNEGNLTKKLIIQCVICLIMYAAFYAIKNIPNFASQDVMYKISDILEYDINVKKVYDDIKVYFENTEISENSAKDRLIEDTLSVTEEKNEKDSTEIIENQAGEDTQKTENTENTNMQELSQEQSNQEITQLSQMEIDAQYIKEKFSLIKPLEGEITSRFGWRNPSVPTVPKNHTGIDIARVQGTVIIAAMDGTVELVSSEGDLR